MVCYNCQDRTEGFIKYEDLTSSRPVNGDGIPTLTSESSCYDTILQSLCQHGIMLI